MTPAASSGTVARISVAPVKGLGLVHPDSVELTRAGVLGDRRFALVGADGRLVSGKKLGPMVRVRPTYDEASNQLSLLLPDGSDVTGEVEVGATMSPVFYGEPRAARVVVGPWSEALSTLAGAPLTLVRMDDGDGVDRVGEGSVTLLSESALAAMADAAGLDTPIDSRRFRMTFTLDGLPAHEEDAWIGHDVAIGDAVVRPVGNVGRCATTTQDPDTGIKTLDTLKLIQAARGHLPTTEPLPFGVHAEVVRPGWVAVGDAVVRVRPTRPARAAG